MTKGIVYCDANGKPDETRRFLNWEDWVEWHDQRDREHDEAEFKALTRAVGQFFKEQIAKATEPLLERISALEATLGEFGYRGTWQEGIVYRAGNFVTLSGSMWACNATETTSRPTTDNSDWSLAVKRGRDGKSAEPRRLTAARTLTSNV
jgi:hypothetical protein